MALNFSPTISIKYLLVTAGLMLTSPVIAENKMFFSPTDDKQVSTDNDDAGLEQTLEHNFSPEDRARLRKALSDYAKHTDPEHNQIELKRKAMKDSITQRFNDCNRDNDDSLDREETTQCLPQIARHFSYVDVDEDGVITLEELELAQAKSIERQKAAEARMEAQRIQEKEAEIKNLSKSKVNKQAANGRKRPS
ncbi:EF-hand domain-containing protein [Methylotenera sp. 1P/1]|uniref:EF-hand domain-containing protein n=1 Tax=Methylotenera sp. 1P/1 TaxID=1131551 RepID=UPI00037F665F|nr:EF-hand domain-containing protein [Methylotenera sp. 1P/1]